MYSSSDEREFLTGLRGKDRAKMVYAMQQSRIDFDQVMATFDNEFDTKERRNALYAQLGTLDKAIREAQESAMKAINMVYNSVNEVMAPYKIANPGGMSFYGHGRQLEVGYVIDQARWALQRDTANELRKTLYDYKKTLATRNTKVTTVLTDTERAEVIKDITTIKALPSGPTQTVNDAGEIEVIA